MDIQRGMYKLPKVGILANKLMKKDWKCMGTWIYPTYQVYSGMTCGQFSLD